MTQFDPKTKDTKTATADFETYFLKIPRAELGGLIKEYIAESNHGGWDGFSSRDITGIKRMLFDVMMYHYYSGHGGPDNPTDEERYQQFAIDTSNINPVP